MTTRDFTANVISANKGVPDGNFKNSKASGVWDINEALDLIKGGNWPNAANISPESFVDGLFSTNVWDGGGSTATTITNGVDLSNKGGMVLIKSRTNPGTGNFHHLVDSERGQSSGFHKALYSNGTEVENQYPSSSNGGVSSFNSNGFTVGPGSNSNHFLNASGYKYVSWTFRKQPKFFDVVTYTGTGSTQNISHNLGSVPGMIIIKDYSATNAWTVYHRGVDSSAPEDYSLNLGSDAARDDATSYFNDTAPTSSVFTVGTTARTNNSGSNYVAYLFAHNDGDGGFGESEDQDIIKCGSYSGSGTHFAPEQDIGFEPQWLLVKQTTGTKNWVLFDNIRGLSLDTSLDNWIYPNTNGADNSGGSLIELKSTGFKPNGSSFTGTSGKDFIYVAIRRGGMQTPSTASDVFAIDDQGESSAPYSISGFPVDMVLRKDTDGSRSEIMTRVQHKTLLVASATDAEASDSVAQFDFNNGCLGGTSQDTTKFSWMWKRARGYFDVVGYSGTGSAQNISHNLGVTPEMMWVKCRSNAENWVVYHSYANTKKWYLNLNAAQTNAGSQDFNDTPPTSSVFTVGDGNDTGASGRTYINFLFATAAGVSKVGSYTGNGNATGPTVDCGFSNGTKFVLLKRTTGLQNWYIYDTTRGLTSGDDKELEINSNSAERTGQVLNSTTSGFQLATSSSFANEDGTNYIFYAIAA